MEDWKVRAAQALDPTLSKFLSLNGILLQRVLAHSSKGCVDRIVFDFGKSRLSVRADGDDDSLDLGVESKDSKGAGWVDLTRRNPWRHCVGKPFGWGWVAVNQQGYPDGLLISFGNIRPQLMLNVVASSIKTASINFL